ncbi:pyridine nucleotide-disulfide oxidoreductase [Kocuria sp. CNJ-770]|uniref:NAD(P)/FAD-dependent oxidoreductase n=1 Tax=Kocuria sp. CNJ-770 TaxID=1904964 RepID=UPI00095E9AAD|nr:FAD-dependent oxidoreductase [Kocuria sp. CNJ-770]OLT04717.1 pyridine nucleotide-disulfide oxidoreductase [Kocuria sp. CNJ-770]
MNAEHSRPGVVVVGGGHAGMQAAESLRTEGYEGPVTVVVDDPHPPYQRPPLSKDYLGGQDAAPLPLRGPRFAEEHRIHLRTGVSATGIDRQRRTVHLDTGEEVPYTHLVLATGAANRRLTCLGAELDGVHGLRTLADAQRLNAELAAARRVVVVGAGFIGLEFAAGARARGLAVTVLEFAPRPMGRAVSPVTGDWFAQAHIASGVDLRLGEGIDRCEGTGRVEAVVSTTGDRYPADLVVVGIGVAPNTALAGDAGLEVDNGVVVDASLRTSDPAVLAVGDCASFPSVHAGVRSRLESVQNATDQARHAARTILGRSADYTDLPWFWSQQGPWKLQIAGLYRAGDHTVVRGDPTAGKFSVYCFRDGALVAVESVNRPADHMAARKLIDGRMPLTPAQAADPALDLRAVAHAATIAA